MNLLQYTFFQHALLGSLLAAVSNKIEYYDDEELDQFIGREGNMYTERCV